MAEDTPSEGHRLAARWSLYREEFPGEDVPVLAEWIDKAIRDSVSDERRKWYEKIRAVLNPSFEARKAALLSDDRVQALQRELYDAVHGEPSSQSSEVGRTEGDR